MRTRTALIILLLFLSAPAAQADLTPERTREAHALIAQFSDRRFAVRQQAVNKLVAMGPDVIPLLQKTLGETKDLEVKLRCRMTLKRVTEKYHVVIDDGKAKVLNFGASRITIDETDVPLAEVLGMLVEQSGNRPITPLKIGEERVSLKIKDMPYWQAVDTLCSSSGLAWGAYWGPHLFRVYKVKVPAHYVCVYTGPAAVRVARVTREFTDRRILEFGADRNPVGENHTTHRGIDIQLTFYVEDRLPLISGKMEVTKVLTPDGVNRLATHVGGWRQLSAMRFHGSVPLGIKDTVDGLKGPVTLEGAVALDLGVGAKTLRLDDVFGGNKPTVSDQEIPVTLTLLDATRDADGDTRVSVEMGCPSKSRARSFTHGGPYYGFALIDPNGKRYTQPNGTGTSGGTNKAKVKFSFSRLPRVPGKWSLTFTTPEKTVKKEYPFTIRDVPVP